MGFKRLILNLMFKLSKIKYKRNSSIYATRANYGSFCKIISMLSNRPKDVRINLETLEGCQCLRLIPPNKTDAVVFVIYGGSFVMEFASLTKIYIPFGAILAKAAQAEVWIPEYGIAPENSFPQQGQDCLSNYLSLIKRGINPQDITILGLASGASLALALVMSLRDKGLPMPASVATISAITDLTMTASSITLRADRDPMFAAENIGGHFNHYLQGHSPLNPLASPRYGSYKGFPPMYMMVGGNEIFYDDTILVAAIAEQAGVDVTLDIEENMIHCYPLWYDFIEEGKGAIQRLAKHICDIGLKKELCSEGGHRSTKKFKGS